MLETSIQPTLLDFPKTINSTKMSSSDSDEDDSGSMFGFGRGSGSIAMSKKMTKNEDVEWVT